MWRLLLALVAVAACEVGDVDGTGGFDAAVGEDARVAEDPLVVEMRAVAAASLPFLAAQGSAWIAERGCTSCHAVPVMVWAHALARRRGVAVDESQLAEWTQWAVAETAASRNEEGQATNLDGAYQLILAREADVDGVLSPMYEGLADAIVGGQAADGSWLPGGQLPAQRRPAIEINVSSTMTALLALRSMGRSGDAIDRGVASLGTWKASTDPIQSTEALLLRMLVERELGDDAEFRAQLSALLARQQPDGGWSWLAGESSDAFATGEVLWALAAIGHADETPVRAAWMYLRDSQAGDGSWIVPSTKTGVDGPQPASIQWGTGWGTIGLLRTLPPTP